jgi:hypothetical protein
MHGASIMKVSTFAAGFLGDRQRRVGALQHRAAVVVRQGFGNANADAQLRRHAGQGAELGFDDFAGTFGRAGGVG